MGQRYKVLLLLLLPTLFSVVLYAETEGKPVPDPSAFLGLDLEGVYNTCGPPSEVFAVRGKEPWQDDVVFWYQDGYSLFLFRRRVWQVRVCGENTSGLGGIHIGDPRESILLTLGDPAGEIDGSLLFILPERGYPVRLRVCLTDDAVSDIYLYRSDF